MCIVHASFYFTHIYIYIHTLCFSLCFCFSISMYIYICLFKHIYICIYLSIHLFIYLFICLHICIIITNAAPCFARPSPSHLSTRMDLSSTWRSSGPYPRMCLKLGTGLGLHRRSWLCAMDRGQHDIPMAIRYCIHGYCMLGDPGCLPWMIPIIAILVSNIHGYCYTARTTT